jgi:hypothetical protein
MEQFVPPRLRLFGNKNFQAIRMQSFVIKAKAMAGVQSSFFGQVVYLDTRIADPMDGVRDQVQLFLLIKIF